MIHPLAAILSALLAVTQVTGAMFDGSVVYRVSTPDESFKPTPTRYSLNAGRIRMEAVDTDQRFPLVIFDYSNRIFIGLSRTDKNYLIMPLSAVSSRSPDEGEQFVRRIEQTNRTETIQGYHCRLFLWRDGANTTLLWITDRLGGFLGMIEFAQEIADDPLEACVIWRRVFGTDAFLVRLVRTDFRDHELHRIEAEQIQPAKLPEELFIAPADYKQTTFPTQH